MCVVSASLTVKLNVADKTERLRSGLATINI